MDLTEFKERMKEETIIDPRTECWLYNGGRTGNGYCQIRVDGVLQLVHRISAFFYLGFNHTDRTLQVNHKCTNKNCWNPAHLYIGTQSDNVQDAIRDRTHNQVIKTHCPKGHEYNEENTYISNKGFRFCRICKNESSKKAKQYGA